MQTNGGKIQIIDLVNAFIPEKKEEALRILEMLKPHLYNANSSVTIGVVKTCIKISNNFTNKEEVKELVQELLPPLVQLMTRRPEIQLVVLKTILILFQQFEFLRTASVSIFLCKEDDPPYIQLAKLDVIQLLTKQENVEEVINALKLYSSSPFVSLAKKSISELGRIALFFETAADTCVDCFIHLIENSPENIMEQCICEAVNIIRRYQGQYDNLVDIILKKTRGEVEEPATKSALAWILGQFYYKEDAIELLDTVYIENFLEETTDVQLAILTAVMKTYTAYPTECFYMLSRVMPLATCEVDDPDVRDRAYSYMKLLIELPDFAYQIVTSQEPQIIYPKNLVNKRLVDALIPSLGSISTVLRKFPAEFDVKGKNINIMPLLLDRNPDMYDIVIRGQFQFSPNGDRQIVLNFKNMGSKKIPIGRIEFGYNTFGFVPMNNIALPKIESKKSATVVLQIITQKSYVDEKNEVSNNLKVEVRVNKPESIEFNCTTPLSFLLEPEIKGKFTKEVFNIEWPKVKKEDEQVFNVHSPSIVTLEASKEALRKERVFFFAMNNDKAFFSGRMITNDAFMVIVHFSKEGECVLVLRMFNSKMRNLILGLVSQVFQ